MTTTESTHSPAPARSDEPGPLRLYLDPRRSAVRSVDGAWWPHGRDVVAEVMQLVIGAEHLVGQIDRVALHAGDWPDHPRRFRLGERVMRLGFFSSSQNLVSLVRRQGADVVLLLIPASSTDHEAATAIARAVDSDDRSRPTDMLSGALREAGMDIPVAPAAVTTLNSPIRPAPPAMATALPLAPHRLEPPRGEMAAAALTVWESEGGALRCATG